MSLNFLPTISEFVQAKEHVTSFSRVLLDHLRKLQADGELSELCFGHALLQFGEQEGVTEEDLLHEIQIMFIAGHETTAHTMSWFVYVLSKVPEVQRQCHEAVNQHDPSTLHGEAELPPYLEAVLKESMRRYPMVSRGSARVVRQPEGFVLPLDVLNRTDPNVPARHLAFAHEVTLPAGTWCQVHFYNIQTSVDNWGPGGKDFLPERFLPGGHYLGAQEGEARGTSKTAVPNPLASASIFAGGGNTPKELAFLPFSHGRRNCIGMNLALLEMRIALQALVRGFSFALADPALLDEEEALESVITLRPAKMLPVRVTKRG